MTEDLNRKLQELKDRNKSINDVLRGRSVDLSSILEKSKQEEIEEKNRQRQQKRIFISPKANENDFTATSPSKPVPFDRFASPKRSILKNSPKKNRSLTMSPATEMTISFSSDSTSFSPKPFQYKKKPQKSINYSNQFYSQKYDLDSPLTDSDEYDYEIVVTPKSKLKPIDFLEGIFDDSPSQKYQRKTVSFQGNTRNNYSPSKHISPTIRNRRQNQTVNYKKQNIEEDDSSSSSSSDSEVDIEKIRAKVQRRRQNGGENNRKERHSKETYSNKKNKKGNNKNISSGSKHKQVDIQTGDDDDDLNDSFSNQATQVSSFLLFPSDSPSLTLSPRITTQVEDKFTHSISPSSSSTQLYKQLSSEFNFKPLRTKEDIDAEYRALFDKQNRTLDDMLQNPQGTPATKFDSLSRTSLTSPTKQKPNSILVHDNDNVVMFNFDQNDNSEELPQFKESASPIAPPPQQQNQVAKSPKKENNHDSNSDDFDININLSDDTMSYSLRKELELDSSDISDGDLSPLIFRNGTRVKNEHSKDNNMLLEETNSDIVDSTISFRNDLGTVELEPTEKILSPKVVQKLSEPNSPNPDTPKSSEFDYNNFANNSSSFNIDYDAMEKYHDDSNDGSNHSDSMDDAELDKIIASLGNSASVYDDYN